MPVTDFLHDEAVIDAFCSELKANLPATWTSKVGAGGRPQFSLKRCEFGDLRDYRPEPEETLRSLTPMILVKPISNSWNRQRSGLGGKQAINYGIRLVHVWHETHNPGTGSKQRMNATRARCQRMKTINQAVFAASDRQLGNPTLTCADTGITARVNVCEYVAARLAGVEDEEMLPGNYYAISIDLNVITTTA